MVTDHMQQLCLTAELQESNKVIALTSQWHPTSTP